MPAAPAADAKPVNWQIPLVVVIVGMFMSVLDMSIVNVAVPAIRADYGESTESIQWISTSYSLTEGVAVPAAAWLGMRFGLKRVYIWSLIGFTVASALCGLAGDLGQMVLFRILQAIPGGVIPVTCLTLLFRMVPMDKIGAAMGIFGLGVTAAPGLGPTLGGYLVEHTDWRLIFIINVPIGILGVVAAMAVLPNFPAERGKPFDLWGFLTIAGSLFALLLALEEGADWGWTGYRVLILLAVAANLMALFVVIELQVKNPLLNLRVFTYWPFVNSMILNAAISIGLFATLFYIPSFLQSAQRLTPWHAGLVMAPLAVVLMVMMPITGRLYDRFGARWLAMLGLSINSLGLMMLSQINVNVDRLEVVIGTMIMCGGTGLAMMPIMTGGMSAVPPHLADYASGFSTLIQRVSAGLGLAGMTAMVSLQHAQIMADRSGLLSADGADADPRVVAMQANGQEGLLGLWQQLGNQVQAQTYGNAFIVAGSLTLAGVALAFFLPAGRPSGGGDAPVAH
ncbi:DHA2 family efflux MFS transporter permease subunit [Pseudonocardia eucalypti]|uniref:DHA2 family efflux MFS transporter permease subunit n=1 Tax=Pseudonocardia eucalypti TaxID=648755 RepID=A0ABP9QA50_9PSEU